MEMKFSGMMNQRLNSVAILILTAKHGVFLQNAVATFFTKGKINAMSSVEQI